MRRASECASDSDNENEEAFVAVVGDRRGDEGAESERFTLPMH